jgi:hypothetical protein
VGYAKVESKKRFPLSHSPCYGYGEVFVKTSWPVFMAGSMVGGATYPPKDDGTQQ